jgi:hypothetical protein
VATVHCPAQRNRERIGSTARIDMGGNRLPATPCAAAFQLRTSKAPPAGPVPINRQRDRRFVINTLDAVYSAVNLWRRGQGKRDKARDLLAAVYGWFTGGFNTLDLKEAKALCSMSCMPDQQIQNRPEFVAVRESLCGPSRRCHNSAQVRCSSNRTFRSICSECRVGPGNFTLSPSR